MKRIWLALLMAPALLCNCGSDDTQGHDWSSEAPANKSNDVETTEPPGSPEKKGVVTGTSAEAHKLESQVASHDASGNSNQSTKESSNESKPPRKLSSDLVNPGWILNGVGDTTGAKDWHFVVKKINRDMMLVDIEEGYDVIEADKKLNIQTPTKPLPPSTEIFSAKTNNYVSANSSWVFKRNPINGECSAIYDFNGYYGDKHVIFYGTCL